MPQQTRYAGVNSYRLGAETATACFEVGLIRTLIDRASVSERAA